MKDLTSLDYIRLLAWIAYYKCNVMLNKTQMQKILFMCYGQALSMLNEPLFKDDTPKAWPFGPVFPRSYKIYEESIPNELTVEEKRKFAENKDILKMIASTVSLYCNKTASQLSDWSHAKDGPWHATVFTKEGTKWNQEISIEKIKSFFNDPNWNSGL